MIGTGLNRRKQFLPTHVSGCELWVETDTASYPTGVIFNGSVVSQLTDLSGNGRHLMQSTESKQPLWVASGCGGILRFNGSSHRMRAEFTAVQPRHVFVLAKWSSVASFGSLVDGAGVNRNILSNVNAWGAEARMYAGTWLAGASPVDGTPRIYEALFNGASSAIGIDGGTQVTGNAGTNDANGFTLCANGHATAEYDWAKADVGAVVSYSRALSELERQRVARYLRRKAAMLGIPLA